MGFFEVLTLIFITLKLTHYIDWSWWLVLSPTLISLSIVFFLIVSALVISVSTGTPFTIRRRKIKK